jgi:hypothetical protein
MNASGPASGSATKVALMTIMVAAPKADAV